MGWRCCRCRCAGRNDRAVLTSIKDADLGGYHVVAPQELQGRSQVPRIRCDDRPDQLQRLRLRAALGALPECYPGRAVPHHLRLRAAISGCSPKTRREGSRSISPSCQSCWQGIRAVSTVGPVDRSVKPVLTPIVPTHTMIAERASWRPYGECYFLGADGIAGISPHPPTRMHCW